MSTSRRIALFGGTFDPVHLGHLEMAERAVTALDLDQVRFLPCKISPHKKGNPPTPGEDRLEMLTLALKAYPWAIADDYELQSPSPSFSSKTAAEMTKRFPSTRLFWIVGRDQWDALPTWHDPGKLSSLVEFIVFARDGAPQPREGWRMHYVEGDHPASATAIRRAVNSGSPPPWTTPEVASYIASHQLYRD